MQTVSREQIEQAWDELASLEESDTKVWVNDFMQEQPALGIYLFASTESVEEEGGEGSKVIDLALAAWRAMSQAAGRPLETVEPEAIERAEDANTKGLEQLAEGSEMDWNQFVQDIVGRYNQRELLGFGLELLMSDNEESPELAPDFIGLELLEFKTVLDCLDQ
jgi:hypothetical protein